MDDMFQYDERLGIHVPHFTKEWTEHSLAIRGSILERWEVERGQIPQRIAHFEAEIAHFQEAIHSADDWEDTVALMDKISDYASRIADLNILFRTQPDLETEDSQEPSHLDY